MTKKNFNKQEDTTLLRNKIFAYVKEQYDTAPEYLWARTPKNGVLRHKDTKKWYGIIMEVSKKSLGISQDIDIDGFHTNDGDQMIDILDLKCDADLLAGLSMTKGFLPGFHMNKKHWITVLLDGSVPLDNILPLLDMSYAMTSSKKSKTSSKLLHNTQWIIPANPKYYDVEKAFAENNIILWKQSNSIAVGDIIYLYVAAPVSAIRYKCRAVEVDIPYKYDDDNITIKKAMKIQLLDCYDQKPIDFAMLKEFGVYAVRGPRSMPQSLAHEIEVMYHS